VYARFGRQIGVDTEPVHAQERSVLGDLGQVVEVCRVARVTDDDLPQIRALFLEHSLRDQAGACAWIGVDGDGGAGLSARLTDRPHRALDALGEPGGFDGAFEEGGLDYGVGAAL